MFCGTWNCAAKKPEDVNLSEWLLPTDGQVTADLYVVGFQEIVDLNAVNVTLDSASAKATVFWQEKITSCLAGSSARYTHVVSRYLVGLLLCVYVKDSVVSHVQDVRTVTAGVGMMGMMG